MSRPDESAVEPPRWFNGTVDALLVALPILTTVALYLPSGLLMPARLVTIALVGLALWQVIDTRRLPASRLLVPVAALFGVIGAFGVIGLARFPQGSAESLVQFGFIAVICLAMSVLGARRRANEALIVGWLASGLLAAAVGLWEVITAHHLPGNAPAREFADTIPGWNVISSFFDNPNLYAYHLVLTILMLPVVWFLGRRWGTWVALLAAPLFFFLLIETSGRMALVALAAGLAIWALHKRWSRIALAGFAVLVPVTMALKLPPGAQIYFHAYQLLDGLQWEDKSSWTRMQLAKSGWWMAGESNYLGVGPGGFDEWAVAPQNPYLSGLSNPHFGLVEVLAEYGVVSAVLLLAAFVAAAVVAWRAVPLITADGDLRAGSPRDVSLSRNLVRLAGILALTAPLISITHSTWLSQPLTAAHLGTLVGLLAFATQHYRSEQRA